MQLRVLESPVPMLRYEERPLVGAAAAFDARQDDDTVMFLIGWNEGPPRWGRMRGDRAIAGDVSQASIDRQTSAIEAAIDLVRDPRAEVGQGILADLLRLPAWQFALGTLDESLARLEAAGAAPSRVRPSSAAAGDGPSERIAYRVVVTPAGAIDIEPLVQKRTRGGAFSKGSALNWFQLPDRGDLTPADRRAVQAHDDRFARRGAVWGAHLTPAQVFGVLKALIDHPAVFLAGQRDGARLDIRQGRLRLRFVDAADASLSPRFDLLGAPLLPPEAGQALRDDQHVIYLHHPAGAPPQVLLAQVGPEAAALVRALAVAPARFPPEAHDALATRLEPLQETVDIELPSRWTRTIGPADGRVLVRLELLASGALQVRLCMRPVKRGPVFAPGEGPALVLEGQGRERHGAKRDHTCERQAARDLVERLHLDTAAELEAWCWRVAEGDPAFDVVAALAEADADVTVEWANDHRLVAMGTVGRRDMRMKVADQRDWFAVEGGAAVGG